MNNLQMLKKAMLAYVSAVKFIWSSMAYPLSIVGKKLMNLRGYRVYGNSVQDGTPTPDSPVEIQSVGDLSTKNLFDISDFISFYTPYWALPTEYGYHDEVGEECLKVYGSINADGRALYYMENRFKENTSYTFSLDCYDVFSPTNNISGISFICRYTDETSEAMFPYKVRKNKIWKKHSFTSDPNKTVKAITVSYGTGSAYSYIKNLQIEEGTTATEYEPYHKYKIPVVARGKNLLDFQSITSSLYKGAYGSASKTERGFRVVCNTSSNSFRLSLLIPKEVFKNGKTYNVSCNATNVGRIVVGEANNLDDTSSFNKYGSITGTSGNFTPNNITNPYLNIYFYGSTHNVGDIITIEDIQLEEGTIATSYEQYISPVTVNIFLDEPLRKVGDYADYVDFEKQKVVIQIGVMTLDGDESTLYTFTPSRPQEGYSCYRYMFSVAQGTAACFCDKIPYKEFGYSVAMSGTCISFDSSKRYLIFKIPTEWASTLDEFKTWLANNPTYVTHAFATPTEETVKLPALPQFKGTTIYEVGTNIKPSGIEAKYC